MKLQPSPSLIAFILFLSLILPSQFLAECECEADPEDRNRSKAMRLKVAAMFSILAAGAVGVLLPIIGRSVPALRPENDIFFLVKAFAAGVILATATVHVLPDAFEDLMSPCLKENPWGRFPFAGFVAMMSAIGTLTVDAIATGYYMRLHSGEAKHVDGGGGGVKVDEERAGHEHAGHAHLHTHSTHGHAHGPIGSTNGSAPGGQLIRHRVISQVLELGIVVHSVIIGISLGASVSPSIITPLVGALSFHQFFEGIGLGGCIVQAQFKEKSMAIMSLFFALTTPVGVAIGLGISTVYNENSPTALIIEGVFNSASAGILIYMALVDLLASDFMNPRMQKNGKLQLGANASLLLGAGCMSLMAKWA